MASTFHHIAAQCKKFDKIIIVSCSSSSSIATRINKLLFLSSNDNNTNNPLLDVSSSSNSNNNKTGMLLCASRDEFHVAVAFFISLSSANTNTNFKLGLCELNFSSSTRGNNCESNNNNIFQEILSIQLVVDPIFSPTLFEQDERDFFQQIAKVSISSSSSANLPKREESMLLMSIIFDTTNNTNNSPRKNLEAFFGSKTINIERKIHVWKNFASSSGTTRNHEDDALIQRFVDVAATIIMNTNKKKKVQTEVNALELQKQKLLTERKWSLWVSQRLENNKKPELERGSEQDDKDEEERFQISAKSLGEVLSSSSNSNKPQQQHFEKLIRETTQVMLEQRRGRSGTAASESSKSPLGRFSQMVTRSSPSSTNKQHFSGSFENTENGNNHSASVLVNHDDDEDDETEAIIRALTEKKKSLTLMKRAEDWFAELSARGVPVPLKQLAMSMPYHWRFWLTPMGFLVIGSCFMMFFGIVLLIL